MYPYDFMTLRGISAADNFQLSDLNTGFYEILDAGERCRTLGGGRPKLIVYDGGYSSPWGHYVHDKFQYDTTLYGINPMHIGKFDDGYRHWHEWFRKEKPVTVVAELDAAILIPGFWDKNYQHFITESLPQIHYIMGINALSNLPIIVNDHPHIREILSICYNTDRFIFCSNEKFVKTRDYLLLVQPITRNFDDICEASAKAFKNFRQMALKAFSPQESELPPADKTVFFGRLSLPNNTGMTRVMMNEGEVRELLSSRDIDVRVFDHKSIAEKIATLVDVGTIITPLGANLMNLLFARDGVRVLVIGHPTFKQTAWFAHFASGAGLQIGLMREFTEVTFPDSQKADVNAPFTVDLAKLGLFLDKLSAA